MRLGKVTLNNFLAYGEAAEVDFSQIALAAVTGENGSGKSALCTDALLWPLFGQCRAPQVDGVIRQGARECSVEVAFDLGGATYRVIRTRGLQGGGKSGLELARLDGEIWTPLTGDSIRATEARIVEILGLDYDTFVSASMILQGRADEFTRKTPGERKQVLGSILGLGLYDRLQEDAKGRGRDQQAEADAASRDLASIETQLADRPALEERAGDIRRQITPAEEAVKATGAALEAAAQRAGELQTAAGRYQEMSDRVSTLGNQITLARLDLSSVDPKRERAQKLLANRPTILAACEREAALKAEIAALDATVGRERDFSADLAAAREILGQWQGEKGRAIAVASSQLRDARDRAALLGEVPCAGEDRTTCKLLASARGAADRIGDLQAEVSRLEGQTIPPAAERISAIEAAIAALGYDPSHHQALRNELTDVANKARFRAESDLAEQALAELAEQSRRFTENLSRLEGEKAAAAAGLQEVEEKRAAMTQALVVREAAAGEAERCRQALGVLQRDLGHIEGRLQALAALTERQAGLRATLAQTETEAGAWGKLATCWSRNGVQALLIDSAIPEIEARANELLGRMTAGRMSLQLSTQRETGKHTMAETLDIIITDELGSRPYECWSGAEKFEVDLSLRVAISKLLARRAGRRIELLVIDEGLGSLDPGGRQRFLEAARALGADFAQVLIISHIAELAEALPQRIEVTKGPGGSEVRVLA